MTTMRIEGASNLRCAVPNMPANALAAATGKRLRTLPATADMLKA